MANTFTGPDALIVRLSGAPHLLGPQRDPAASFGGLPASSVVEGLAFRRINAIPGLRVEHIGEANGPGPGSLAVVGDSDLRWTAPGDTPGAAVTLAAGDTRVLQSAAAGKFIRLTRLTTTTNPLQGVETLLLHRLFGNLWGFRDVVTAEATAGLTDYRGVFLENAGALAISNLTLWLGTSDPDLAIASETPDGTGAIQNIPNETTQPTGLSWNTGATHGTGLVIGTLAAGARVGLWIERDVPALTAAAAKQIVALNYRFDYDSVTYDGNWSGHYRVEDDALDVYEFYLGADAPPDFGAAPEESSATLPIVASTPLPVDTVSHLVTRRRNKWDLVSQNIDATLKHFDGAGDPVALSPTAPESIAVESIAEGKVRITALYFPAQEPADRERADEWVIRLRADGVDPVPADTPLDSVAMTDDATIERLEFDTADAYLDVAPIRVLVTTRRSSDGAESENTAAVSLTHDRVPPVAVSPRGSFIGHELAQRPPLATAPGEPERHIIDALNNIYLEAGENYLDLWADTDLVFRIIYGSPLSGGGAEAPENGLYLPSDWDIWNEDISEAGSADPVEVIEWNGNKRLGLNVRGTRLAEIDVGLKIFKIGTLIAWETPTLTAAPFPVWSRYDSTVFQAWDATMEQWVSGASLADNADFTSRVPIIQELNQAAIEALL